MTQTKQPRKPSSQAQVVATTGAVIVLTKEGNVVLTPDLALQVASQLPEIAAAAKGIPSPTEIKFLSWKAKVCQ